MVKLRAFVGSLVAVFRRYRDYVRVMVGLCLLGFGFLAWCAVFNSVFGLFVSGGLTGVLLLQSLFGVSGAVLVCCMGFDLICDVSKKVLSGSKLEVVVGV